MSDTKRSMRKVSDKIYQTRKLQTALQYAPRIYPCAKCDSPVADGYVCGWCGDDDPSCDPKGRLSREDVKDFDR